MLVVLFFIMGICEGYLLVLLENHVKAQRRDISVSTRDDISDKTNCR